MGLFSRKSDDLPAGYTRNLFGNSRGPKPPKNYDIPASAYRGEPIILADPREHPVQRLTIRYRAQ